MSSTELHTFVIKRNPEQSTLDITIQTKPEETFSIPVIFDTNHDLFKKVFMISAFTFGCTSLGVLLGSFMTHVAIPILAGSGALLGLSLGYVASNDDLFQQHMSSYPFFQFARTQPKN